MAQPAPRLNLRHLVAVGVVLPACLAVANHLLLASDNLGDLNTVFLSLLMGFYVLQIGVIGWAVAIFIQPWPLRWFVYGWIMILVDLQLATMNSNGGRSYQGVSCLSTAILTGQLGVIIVWGILGSGHLVWRIPAILIVLSQFWGFFNLLVRLEQQTQGNYLLEWDWLLNTQAVLLSILCAILRFRGYKLLKVERELALGGNRTNFPLQFSIRDVLVWTTALAVLLAIAKAGDLLTMNFAKRFYDPGVLLLFTIGICTALVLILALWAALGQGNAVIRYLVLLTLSLGFGAAIGSSCMLMAKAAVTSMFWNSSYSHWFSYGYWWVGWMFLTGALLAASLIIYQVLGYRLVRSGRRTRGTSARIAASLE